MDENIQIEEQKEVEIFEEFRELSQDEAQYNDSDKNYEEMIAAGMDPKELISVGNAHLFARDIALSYPETATALLDELLYWREKAGRI
jgi:hypothetical protein